QRGRTGEPVAAALERADSGGGPARSVDRPALRRVEQRLIRARRRPPKARSAAPTRPPDRKRRLSSRIVRARQLALPGANSLCPRISVIIGAVATNGGLRA